MFQKKKIKAAETEKDTHHSTSLIPGIHHVGQGQDTANPRLDVGTVIAIVVGMMQLADELQLKPAIANHLAPDIHHTAAVTCQDEFAFEPFILRAFVEDAG
jgi:hypothetical protein